MKTIFMGTPRFSLPSLKRLIDGGVLVECVITQPDRPSGRGMKVTPPPVKEFAQRLGLNVYQPLSVRNSDSVAYIKKIRPDLIVVVAYGGILPKEVIDLPKLGCINLHPSLLPEFRGPGAIPRCIIQGKERTGVTTIYLDEGIDTGDIILQYEVDILPDETKGELEERLSHIGGELLFETVTLIKDGTAPRRRQDPRIATYAPLIKKDEGLIDWAIPAKRLHDLIRGLSPSPCAYTYLGGKRIKIYRSMVVKGTGGEPGEVVLSKKDSLVVSTSLDSISLLEVQPEGKRVMNIRDFLAGHRVREGERFHGYSKGTP